MFKNKKVIIIADDFLNLPSNLVMLIRRTRRTFCWTAYYYLPSLWGCVDTDNLHIKLVS